MTHRSSRGRSAGAFAAPLCAALLLLVAPLALVGCGSDGGDAVSDAALDTTGGDGDAASSPPGFTGSTRRYIFPDRPKGELPFSPQTDDIGWGHHPSALFFSHVINGTTRLIGNDLTTALQ